MVIKHTQSDRAGASSDGRAGRWPAAGERPAGRPRLMAWPADAGLGASRGLQGRRRRGAQSARLGWLAKPACAPGSHPPAIPPPAIPSSRPPTQIWRCSQDHSNNLVHEFFESHHFAAGIQVIPGTRPPTLAAAWLAAAWLPRGALLLMMPSAAGGRPLQPAAAAACRGRRCRRLPQRIPTPALLLRALALPACRRRVRQPGAAAPCVRPHGRHQPAALHPGAHARVAAPPLPGGEAPHRTVAYRTHACLERRQLPSEQAGGCWQGGAAGWLLLTSPASGGRKSACTRSPTRPPMLTRRSFLRSTLATTLPSRAAAAKSPKSAGGQDGGQSRGRPVGQAGAAAAGLLCWQPALTVRASRPRPTAGPSAPRC